MSSNWPFSGHFDSLSGQNCFWLDKLSDEIMRTVTSQHGSQEQSWPSGLSFFTSFWVNEISTCFRITFKFVHAHMYMYICTRPFLLSQCMTQILSDYWHLHVHESYEKQLHVHVTCFRHHFNFCNYYCDFIFM